MRIEYVAAVLLGIALWAPTGTGAILVDQIDNGGFEDGEDGNFAEWRNVSGEIQTTGEAYEGEQAALLNAVGNTTQTTLAQEVSLDNDDAPIVPNTEYEIAFAAVFNTGSNHSASEAPEAFGQIVWKDALGETSRVDTVPIDDTDEYVEYSQTFRAPANATAADIQLHLVREELTDPANANLKVDEVAFGPAEPA